MNMPFVGFKTEVRMQAIEAVMAVLQGEATEAEVTAALERLEEVSETGFPVMRLGGNRRGLIRGLLKACGSTGDNVSPILDQF